MRTTILTAMSILALCGGVHAAELVISLEVDPGVDALPNGTDFPVRVFAQSFDTDGLGTFAFSADIFSHNSGVAGAKQKFPPPGSPDVQVTWDAAIVASQLILLPARRLDIGADGDFDAQGLGFTDTSNYINTTIGSLGAPTLLATVTWTKIGDGQVSLGVDVGADARYYDFGAAPEFPNYSTTYDSVEGIGINEGGTTSPPRDEDQDAGGPYNKGGWGGPSAWNDDNRQITVTGVGDDNDNDTQQLTFEWMIGDHVGGRYGPLVDEGVPPPGQQDTITFSIGQLRGLGFPLPDPVGGDPSQYMYPLIMKVTDPDGSAETTSSIYVPEPGTMALLGFGALALIRRRRQA